MLGYRPGVISAKDAKKNVDYFETEQAVCAFVHGKPIQNDQPPQKRKRVTTERLAMVDLTDEEEVSSKRGKKKKAKQSKNAKVAKAKKSRSAYAIFTQVCSCTSPY
jgi:hypothetical protein